MLAPVLALALLATAHGRGVCTTNNSIAAFKRPTYEFSVDLLYRAAQQEEYHFVYSPLSTWLQLVTLALGARGTTKTELHNVTKFVKNRCYQHKYFQENLRLRKNLYAISEKSSLVVVHKLVGVKKKYMDLINRSRVSRVVPINFDDAERAAAVTNGLIERDTRGVIKRGVYADDFEKTLLFLTDNGYFKSDWLHPFDPLYTSEETFRSENDEEIGKVRMMSQLNYFKVASVPHINARILELPFNARRKLSMLIALPIEGSIGDIFYALKRISLRGLFHSNRPKQLVRVKLPRFKLETDISNVAELLNDMGIERIFYPELSDFSGISNTKLFVSLVAHQAVLEVTEEGAKGSYSADFLVKANHTSEFVADRPFAFMIVDRVTDTIQFAGIYSNPSIY